MIAKIWTALDPIYFKMTRLTYIEEDRDFNNIFRVRLLTYKGPTIVMESGEVIKKNDVLLKIHLHNIRLLNETKQIKGEIRKARYIQRIVKESLPGLAHYLSSHPNVNEIKGVVGITTIRKCIKPLGFETFEIYNPLFRYYKLITCSIIYLSFNPKATTKTLKRQSPVYLFMSKEKLLKTYL